MPATLELNQWQERVWVKVHPLREGAWAPSWHESSRNCQRPRSANADGACWRDSRRQHTGPPQSGTLVSPPAKKGAERLRRPRPDQVVDLDRRRPRLDRAARHAKKGQARRRRRRSPRARDTKGLSENDARRTGRRRRTVTRRKVIAFLSDNHIDPDIAVESFILEPR